MSRTTLISSLLPGNTEATPMRKPLLALLAAAALVVAVPARPAYSTSVEPLSAEELVDHAQTIVWGDCISVRTEWNRERTKILTRVQLASREVLKGDRAPTVELLLPGGELDGMAYVIHGMPRFREGQEAVVHVTAPHATSGIRLPVGLGQGVHTVERTGAQPVVRRDLRDLNFVVRGQPGGLQGGVDEEPLEDMLVRVRGLVTELARRAPAGGGR